MSLSNLKKHGVSHKEDGNMCFRQGQAMDVVKNRKRFFKKAGIDSDRTVVPDIVHGSDVKVVAENDLGKGVFDAQLALKVDGVISYIPDSILAVDTADCPVILFSNQKRNMIALAHAGWKSLDGGIIQNIVNKIQEKTSLDQVSLQVGVSICADCYNFPANADHPLLTNPNWKTYRTTNQDGSISIDLIAFIQDKLKQEGIRSENIKIQEDCNCHARDAKGQNLYYSHRRASRESEDSAKKEGRFLTFIHLPEQE